MRALAVVLSRRSLLCGGAVAGAAALLSSTSGAALCTPATKTTTAAPLPPPPPPPKPPAEESGPSLAVRCLAEAVGTAIIVQGGCGCVAALKYAGANFTTFGLATTWGATVALAVYATRAISGAHLNPAVTTALVANDYYEAVVVGGGEISRDLRARIEEAPLYIGSQLLGATVAGAINYVLFSAGIAASEAAASITRGTAASTASFAGAFGMVPNTALMGAGGAFVAEVYMTAILLFMISAITDGSTGSVPDAAAPAAIGATVAMLICTFGPVTGCGMNPARDLGPRAVTLLTGWGSAALTSWWVYTLGPLVGGAIGVAAYRELRKQSK